MVFSPLSLRTWNLLGVKVGVELTQDQKKRGLTRMGIHLPIVMNEGVL